MNEVQPVSTVWRPALYANSGGPMSRTRKVDISSTLLGKDDGYIKCPRRIRLALKFEDTHPVDFLESILAAEGLGDPDELRSKYALPQERLICQPLPEWANRLSAVNGPRSDVLEQALMLGLCTAHLFDPERPVLWTETSLTRAVELFDPAGFYA